MANSNLTNAKRAKNDEFYTQFGDIQKEIEAYLEYNPDVFRGKVVYCNCDDPFEKYSKHKEIKGKKAYEKYDNYDAIEVSFIDSIPSDYNGVMGVPISFLDKYNPDQFEIIGMAEDNGKGFSSGIWDGKNPHCVINGENKFKRIFIKHKKAKK